MEYQCTDSLFIISSEKLSLLNIFWNTSQMHKVLVWFLFINLTVPIRALIDKQKSLCCRAHALHWFGINKQDNKQTPTFEYLYYI